MRDLKDLILRGERESIPDSRIDLSDIPEITDFSKGWLRNAKTPARQTGEPDARKTGKRAAGRT